MPCWRQVEPSVQKLFEYIYERGTIAPIEDYSAELLQHGDVSQIVTESIRAGTPDWESLVPRHVCEQIKAQNLLGYREPATIKIGSGNGHGTPSNGAAPRERATAAAA